MILSDKNVADSKALKMVAKLLKKQPSAKGFKLKTNKGEQIVTPDELIQFVETLAEKLDAGDYGEIHRCDTCGNFSRSGKRKDVGACFPKTYTATRLTTDHCSGWTPMDAEQRHIKERMDEHFG